MIKISFSKKIILVLMLTIIINCLFCVQVNFAEGEQNSLTKMPSPIYNPSKYDPGNIQESRLTNQITAKLVKWLRNVGLIVGTAVLTIIGVKYMLAGGAEEKAQYKETMMPMVIGVIMLFGCIILMSSISKLV